MFHHSYRGHVLNCGFDSIKAFLVNVPIHFRAVKRQSALVLPSLGGESDSLPSRTGEKCTARFKRAVE